MGSAGPARSPAVSTSIDTSGLRYVVCCDCGAEGPHRKGSRATREAAKAEGWSRIYPRGRGEDFRCPACRNRVVTPSSYPGT